MSLLRFLVNNAVLSVVLTVATVFIVNADEVSRAESSSNKEINAQCTELKFIPNSINRYTPLPICNESTIDVKCTAKVSTMDGESSSYSDSKKYFCDDMEEVSKFSILQQLRLTKPPENIKTQAIPKNHYVFKRLKSIGIYKETDDIDYVVLFPIHVEKSGKKLSMTFQLSQFPENFEKKNVIFADIEFFSNAKYQTQFVTHTPKEERENINESEASAAITRNGWASISIKHRFARWNLQSNTPREIAIESERLVNNTIPISTNPTELPFIIFSVNGSSIEGNYSCKSGDNLKRCEKVPVHVNFAAIKWDNWIIYPENYTSYYCNDFCDQDFMKGYSCRPSEKRALLLIYWQSEVLIANMIPDMIVEKCTCISPKYLKGN